VKLYQLFQNLREGKDRRHDDVTRLQLKCARNRKHMTKTLASLRRRARQERNALPCLQVTALYISSCLIILSF